MLNGETEKMRVVRQGKGLGDGENAVKSLGKKK